MIEFPYLMFVVATLSALVGLFTGRLMNLSPSVRIFIAGAVVFLYNYPQVHAFVEYWPQSLGSLFNYLIWGAGFAFWAVLSVIIPADLAYRLGRCRVISAAKAVEDGTAKRSVLP